MSARAAMGLDFNTYQGFEPITKTDGLLWLSSAGQILVWYNGAWRSIINAPIDPYNPALDGNPPTPVPTPADAAIVFCCAQIGTGAGPISPPAAPPPYADGQLWFNTSTMRLNAFNKIGWIQIQ